MRIAFLNPQGNFDPADRYWTAHPDFGGQLVYVKEVAQALGKLGHQADILTRRIVDPEWDGFEHELDHYPGHPHVRIIRLDCGPAGFLRKELLWPHLPEWTEQILGFYRRENQMPDVWTGHYADGGLAGILISRATRRPFTFTGHSLGAQKLERLLESANQLDGLDAEFHFGARLAAERVVMSRAGRIIVSTRQEQEGQYGHRWYAGAIDATDRSRFAVIPPGVNLALFDRGAVNAKEEETQLKVERALARDLSPERVGLPCVLASARLEPKKNHVGLVRAFASSPELETRANLLFAVRGLPGSLRKTEMEQSDLPGEARAILSQIKELADRHGLWGKLVTVSLEGQDELAATYRHLAQRHSIFCLPARHEPFGLAPLEAMAAGLPVVATRFGGPSESMVDEKGEYGVLVNPEVADELAAGLLRLLRDEKQWVQFQRAGHRRVLDRYTWERTAEGYAAVCRELTEAPLRTGGQPIPEFFLHPERAAEPAARDVIDSITG
jgi:sucrose-phosphate synthase